jgi:hypothetical protein
MNSKIWNNLAVIVSMKNKLKKILLANFNRNLRNSNNGRNNLKNKETNIKDSYYRCKKE